MKSTVFLMYKLIQELLNSSLTTTRIGLENLLQRINTPISECSDTRMSR